MGCDIHLHQEVKINGTWHHLRHVDHVDRCYWLFEQMAGVRGDDANAIVMPKGMPEDVTFLTAHDYHWWDTDAHTPSWFNIEEIRELRGRCLDLGRTGPRSFDFYKAFGFCLGSEWEPEPEHGVEDVRWVFWFDN